eukprot:s1013_g10.t1
MRAPFNRPMDQRSSLLPRFAPLETTSWAPSLQQAERSRAPMASPQSFSGSFSGTGGSDPLRSANTGYGYTASSTVSGTYAAEPAHSSFAAPGGSFTGGGYASASPPVSSSYSGVPAAQQQPVASNVVGRPKTAAAAEDSEDDLAGWDS